MAPMHLTYLKALDVERLALTDDEILDAVEAGLKAQGQGATVVQPRVHLVPESSVKGRFNVARGYVGSMWSFRRRACARPNRCSGAHG